MQYNLESLTTVKTKCGRCGKEAQATTFTEIVEDTSKPLGKMVAEDGYVTIVCSECNDENRSNGS